MAKAPDLQIWASNAAGEGQRRFEVAAGVVDVQRPQLGNAQVHERRRAMVIGAPLMDAGRLPFQRPHRLPRSGKIAALTRQPEPCATQPWVEEPPPLAGHQRSQTLRDGEVSRTLVETAVIESSRGESQGQLGIRLGGVGWESGQQRAQSRVAAVEDQIDIVVGEQPGGVRPVARGLSVLDRVDHEAVVVEPLCRRAVQ